eukprot:2912572-Rhodomonas_salina.1
MFSCGSSSTTGLFWYRHARRQYQALQYQRPLSGTHLRQYHAGEHRYAMPVPPAHRPIAYLDTFGAVCVVLVVAYASSVQGSA